MKLLIIGGLFAALAVLLTVAVLVGYRQDREAIRWFPGTGIAGKIDVGGAAPAYIEVENVSAGVMASVPILADGTFVAPLEPGAYELRLPGDNRSVSIQVPTGDCVDLVLDFRFPPAVLEVPREGWPLPRVA